MGKLNGAAVTVTAERSAAATLARRRRQREVLARALRAALAGVVLFACYLGQSPTDVVHVAGAMTYTLVVLTAAALARGRRSGTEGATGALIAAGIMLAPQLGPGTQALVLSPGHTGTCVPVLLVFLLIDRSGYLAVRGPAAATRSWYVPVLVWLALSWTALADAMTVFVAVIPLSLVCAIRMWHGMTREGEPFAKYGREVFLAIAALFSVTTELAAAAMIRAHGGWQVNGLPTGLAAAGQLIGNARLTFEGVLELFGANVFGVTTAFGTALAVAHLAGLALAVAGVLTAARQFLRRDCFVEAVLVAGIAIGLAAYLAAGQAVNILATREIAPVLPFAAVLAGRCLAPPCPARRLWLYVIFAFYAAGLGYAAVQPPVAPQSASLTAARAIATFGPPANRYRYAAYDILVWPHGGNWLAHLRL